MIQQMLLAEDLELNKLGVVLWNLRLEHPQQSRLFPGHGQDGHLFNSMDKPGAVYLYDGKRRVYLENFKLRMLYE